VAALDRSYDSPSDTVADSPCQHIDIRHHAMICAITSILDTFDCIVIASIYIDECIASEMN